jgi:hypothetical protein
MNATSFEFTMTMPADARLVGAVRDLAVHAAKYAQLADPTAAVLAEQVARAAAASIEATHVQDAPIDIHFTGDDNHLEVRIACEVVAAGRIPESRSESGLTVDWSRNGSRQTCLIAHRRHC